MMPESWTFQRPWEDFFTVVQWDQRGAGKTFSTANRQPDASMSIDRMQADAEQLIEWLRATYGKKKIFVMGHSWGSVLGLKVAQHHPEWLYAYIGVGQVVNSLRNETVGYQQTLAQAKADLETARLNLGYTEICSPIDGYVGNRAAQVGAYVANGAYLLSVIPAHGLWRDACTTRCSG